MHPAVSRIAPPQGGARAIAPPSMTLASTPASELERKIASALEMLGGSTDGSDPNGVKTTLVHALAHVRRGGAALVDRTDATEHPDDFYLSLVRSAINTKAPTVLGGAAALTGADIIGFKEYEDLDYKMARRAWPPPFSAARPVSPRFRRPLRSQRTRTERSPSRWLAIGARVIRLRCSSPST